MSDHGSSIAAACIAEHPSMAWNRALMIILVGLSLLGCTRSVRAEGSGMEAEQEAAQQENVKPITLPRGQTQSVPQFGGPSSVGGELNEDEMVFQAAPRIDLLRPLLNPYFEFKDDLVDQAGLTIGFDYTTLWQGAYSRNPSLNAAGGIFRAFGNWNLLGRSGTNPGSIVYKLENRHGLDTEVVPQDLGFESGYIGLTASPYSRSNWLLTNLYWSQKLFDGRLSLSLGQVDTTDYVNVYGLVNPWTSFSNLAFQTGGTIPAPNQGLGMAAGVMVTDQLYMIGGIADANGDPSDPASTFNSFFDDTEYFKHIEIGWTTNRERIFLDNVHLTAWHVDERTEAATPSGWGFAFSASTFIKDRWMPFLRLGYANDGGALWSHSATLGVGYYLDQNKDLLGFAVNWNKPSASSYGPGLSDQVTMELFYRFQLTPELAITPDIQWVVNPALAPDQSHLWVVGVRARLAL